MKPKRSSVPAPMSSMADIAFLLLIFFLVTTTIASDQGLPVLLPPEVQADLVKLKDRNVLNILINSSDKVLVENETLDEITGLNEQVMEFVLNPSADVHKSESPKLAVISIQSDRNTSQRMFVRVLDEVHKAYNLMYADRLGITLDEWRYIQNHLRDPAHRARYNEARGVMTDGRVQFPMQISIAEPR